MNASALPTGYDGSEIAICGMAGRFPGAPDIDRFWRNLCEGVESITRFTDEELRAAGEDEEKLADPSYVKARPILDDVERFDAAFFGFAPREAEILDPQTRLFLECVHEALEQAGCDTERQKGAISLFAGASFSNYLVHNLYGNRTVLDAFGDVQATILNVQDALVTMAGYKLNLRGPCCAVQTFCSTSLVAVHLACQSLLGYESDVALAGGVTVYVPQRSGYRYEEGSIVSPDGHCRTFDARAGGTVFGSGVGVVVLKRLADALAERDTVHAIIRGSAVNNDGGLKVSYAAPGVVGQTQVVVEALAAAGVEPDTIGYVEAHGTGTLLGDPAEVAALVKAFRGKTARRGFCALGSVKANVGHLDAAAGVTGLIKAVLCVKNGLVPPSLHFETPNPQIDFASSPFYVNTALRQWEAGLSPRRAAVSAFGVGGTNAHVILEEAPVPPPAEPGRAEQLLPVSARTQTALEEAIRRLAAHLRAHPEADLADVAWTLQVGRRAHGHRWVAACSTVPEAVAALEGREFVRARRSVQDRRGRPVAFVFPGGPVPAPDVGRALYEREPFFREAIERTAAAARPLLGEDLAALLYPGPGRREDAARRLREPAIGEAALFALEYALARHWMQWGVRAEAIAGSGTGERVAACVGEALSLEEALRAVVERRPSPRGGGSPAIPLLSVEALVARGGSVRLELGPAAASVQPPAPSGAAEREAVACLREPEERTGSVTQALEALGDLWLAGVGPDWAAVHAPARRCRVPLPTYPFERQRHWVEPEKADGAPAPKAPPRETDVARWLYQPVWKTSLVTTAAPGTPLAGPWLVFADGRGIGRALAERLRSAGVEVVTVVPGGTFGGDSRSGYRLDPGRPADYGALVEDLRGRGAVPVRIVHLWAVDGLEAGAPVAERFRAASERGFYSLLHLLQALGRPPGVGRVELAVITSGLCDILGRETLEPEKSPLLALCTVGPQEDADLRCRSIDLELGAGDPGEVGGRLLAELVSGAGDAFVAQRGAKRWTLAFEPLPGEAGAGPLAAVRPGGTYLVTGGLGNVGFVAAVALARGARAKLVLVSRSAVPERDEWERWLGSHPAADPTSVRIKKVQALEASGAEVLAVAADVADPAQVRRALDIARARFGDIHGVVHAAGRLGPEDFGPIQGLSRESCEQLFAAKARGLLVLESQLAEPAPDFWLLTSSLSTVLGGLGYAAYAAGNVFLDHFAAERGRRGGAAWISVDFDQWRFLGRGPEGTGRAGDPGATAITPPEGLRLIEHLLRKGATGQVVVSTTPLRERLARWVGLGDRPVEPAPAAPSMRPRPALAAAYVAPRDQPEWAVAAIFEELLGIRPVGVNDDFFELGGHSLFAARTLSRLHAAFGLSFPLSAFFETPTAAGIAARIGAALAAREGGSRPEAPAGGDRVKIEL